MEVETNEYRENRLAAMAELEKLGFRAALMEAMKSCNEKSELMSR